jgi:hypothetical protein
MSEPGKVKTAGEWAEDRAKALEIANCFEMIAPTAAKNSMFPHDGISRSEDLEPLAAAIREGRQDLFELALSARHCSAPPETHDLRVLNSDASECEKAEASKRREAFERSFRHSPEMLRTVVEWMVYLLVNGHCRQVGEAKNLSKADVLEFIEKTFPEAQLVNSAYEKPVVPERGNKKARAEFWRRAGVDPDQSRGERPAAVRAMMKRIESAIESAIGKF